MSRREFIRQNREELTRLIAYAIGADPDTYTTNDDERETWILNDESLYRWARSEGVKI